MCVCIAQYKTHFESHRVSVSPQGRSILITAVSLKSPFRDNVHSVRCAHAIRSSYSLFSFLFPLFFTFSFVISFFCFTKDTYIQYKRSIYMIHTVLDRHTRISHSICELVPVLRSNFLFIPFLLNHSQYVRNAYVNVYIIYLDRLHMYIYMYS